MYDFYTVRTSFETFKSNVGHRLKSLGDLEFIVEILKSNNIIILYNKNTSPLSISYTISPHLPPQKSFLYPILHSSFFSSFTPPFQGPNESC